MQDTDGQPIQWVSFTGSGNNVAFGAGARAGNTTVGGSGEAADVSAVLAQIRNLAASAPDQASAEQAHAAVDAIESDLAKPQTHRFSVGGALAALGKLCERMPQLTQLVDSLTKLIHTV